MVKENLNLVYKEVSGLQKQQQDAITLLNNKLNWILVSDFVFLATLLNLNMIKTFSAFSVLVSICIALFALRERKFHFTAKVLRMLECIDNEKFMIDLIKKKKKAFDKNKKKKERTEEFLFFSKFFLFVAVLAQFLVNY